MLAAMVPITAIVLLFVVSSSTVVALTFAENYSISSSIQQYSRRRGTHRSTLCLAPQQHGVFEELSLFTSTERRVWLYDLINPTQPHYQQKSIIDVSQTIPYHEAWELQKQIVDAQLTRIGKCPKDYAPLYEQFVPNFENDYLDNDGSSKQPFLGCDSIILLQHDPVYTLGTASDPSFIIGRHGVVPTVRIERGGEVTYHGPGQLTVYPILDLRGYKQDVHWYIRALEEVILRALAKAGVKDATREEGLTGVWTSSGKKIAALGIKTRRWITMHGMAINIDLRSLQNFDGIVPCGLQGRKVTCINEEVNDATHQLTVAKFADHMKGALGEVFNIHFVPFVIDQEGSALDNIHDD